MTRELTKEEIQASYDSEQANIGKFSSLLSASCKYAWAGSLAIFFSTIVASSPDTLARFKPVFYFLWAGAFLGAAAFVFEIGQYIFAYWHAREFTAWLATQRSVTLEVLQGRATSKKTNINATLFYLKLICSALAALFVAIGIFIVAFQIF
jgi:hypothetical protein